MDAAIFQGKVRILHMVPIGRSGIAMTFDASQLPPMTVGQFLMLDTHGMMWRPMCVSDVNPGTAVTVTLDVVGSGTRWLAERCPGEEITAAGPFGVGFPAPEPGISWAVVGAGAELAVLGGVLRQYRAAGSVGCYTVGDDTPWTALMADICQTFDIAYRSVSIGDFEADRVNLPPIVMAAGPRSLVAIVARTCQRQQRRCYALLHERMACAVGACWGCVVASAGPPDGPYLRVCRDGPVFDATRVAFPL